MTMRVNMRATHTSKGPMCPFISTPQEDAPCIEDECELWVTDSNDKFSGCIFAKMYRTLVESYFSSKQ